MNCCKPSLEPTPAGRIEPPLTATNGSLPPASTSTTRKPTNGFTSKTRQILSKFAAQPLEFANALARVVRSELLTSWHRTAVTITN